MVESHLPRCYRMTVMGADASVEMPSTASLEQLKVFPLPETVLFPGTILPLHIFEPRYRAMVADALKADRVLAIALLKPGYEADYQGRPPIHDVVGVGRITRVQKEEDGRYYLALQGLCRARILQELPPNQPYRVAATRMLPDVMPPSGEAALRTPLETLRACFLKLLAHIPDRAGPLLEILDHIKEPGALADVLCAAALANADERQRALATPEIVSRLEQATDAVADLLLRAESQGGVRGLPA
ncbi:MAG: LON peptidase substrate-binding domain-containing protein [Myxococcota bacterium]